MSAEYKRHNTFAKPIVSLFLLLAVGVVVASDGTDGVLVTLKADDLVVVQAGELVYQAQCAACHGEFLEGQPNWRTRDENGYLPAPPHNAEGHTWHHSDDLLFEIVKYGPAVVMNDDSYKSIMPIYKGVLSDEDIIAVLSFIKNTWPEEQRSWQDQVNGSEKNGVSPIKKNSSLIEKLFKKQY